MKKTVLRLQGKEGGRAAVVAMMETLIAHGIPFVMANSSRHTGSRETLRHWGQRSDLLFALVRVSDVPLIRLINTQCSIYEKPEVWWRTGLRPAESREPGIRVLVGKNIT